MSYARTGKNSDVYVVGMDMTYGHVWLCESCKAFGGVTQELWSLEYLRAHMGWHLSLMHKVPAKVFIRIERELGETVLTMQD